MSTISNGEFFFFLRTPGPMGLGHIAWGFKTSLAYRACIPSNVPPFQTGPVMTASNEVPQWMLGSLENAGGWPFVLPGADNDYWTMVVDSEAQMIVEMQTLTTASEKVGRELPPYTYYKRIPVPTAYALAAERKATSWFGYSVLGNNCLDNSAIISHEYGTPIRAGARMWQISPINFFEHTLGDYPAIPLSSQCVAA